MQKFKQSKKELQLQIKNNIQLKLRTNFKWQVRALTRLFDDQTINERIDSISDHKNKVGFNSADAYILSKLAEFYNRNGYLSQKQKSILSTKLPKYWKQINKYIEDAKGINTGMFKDK
jgi:hypothetical protein